MSYTNRVTAGLERKKPVAGDGRTAGSRRDPLRASMASNRAWAPAGVRALAASVVVNRRLAALFLLLPASGAVLGLSLLAGGCMPDFDVLTASPLLPDAGTSTSTSTGTSTSAGGGCTADNECDGKSCVGGSCVDPCHDGRVNGSETDVDCGGSDCAVCNAGGACMVNGDCKSDLCDKHVCIEPSCTDGVRDQTETDIDCGGVCSPAHQCAPERKCLVASDCASYLCDSTLQCSPDLVVPVKNMIANMEDQTETILAIDGRNGVWFPYNDGTMGATMMGPLATALPALRAGSKYAEHASGTPYTNWGAGIGFDLNNPMMMSTTKQIYDGSAFTGMQFWGRAETDILVRFEVLNHDTYDGGGVCVKCSDHFQLPVKLTKEWALFKVPFTMLKQQGYGDAVAKFNPAELIGVQFQVSPGTTFDFWIDDVAFIQ